MTIDNYAGAEIEDLPKELFEFAERNEDEPDVELPSKPVGYFRDAMARFAKNRGSVICFGLIVLYILFAVLTPLVSKYKTTDRDPNYSFAAPYNSFFAKMGFWDGTETMDANEATYVYLSNIPGAVKKVLGKKEVTITSQRQVWYKLKVDSYARVGWQKMLLTAEEFEQAREWETRTGHKLFYPVIDGSKIVNIAYRGDQNAWFLTGRWGEPVYKDGKVQEIFLRDSESPDGYAYSISRMGGTQFETRVLYREWYYYKNGHYPQFLFGADGSGYDICVRLAQGARLSLVLSICVALINLIIGIAIGSIEGYYGGVVDLVIERIKDILSGVPSIVFMTLFQIYFAKKVGPLVSMFVAFIFFGWIGTSSTVRAQFYRFKGQEFVMASRTLGAKDSRLIVRHILPNAIGFIITCSVLTIPGVIFSEANLTYLGIVNLQSETMTSVGTMLNNSQSALSTHPHVVFYPAMFISILLICFNEFGNGLRDAFNPNLRGAE